MAVETVLTLTDGSEASQAAFPLAGEICRAFGAELHILTVQELIPHLGARETLGALAREQADHLQSAEATLQAEAKACAAFEGIACTPAVREGSVVEQIIQHAREIGADLIVVASHGRTGLAQYLVGGVAEKLVRHAPCPVLVVRGSA